MLLSLHRYLQHIYYSISPPDYPVRCYKKLLKINGQKIQFFTELRNKFLVSQFHQKLLLLKLLFMFWFWHWRIANKNTSLFDTDLWSKLWLKRHKWLHMLFPYNWHEFDNISRNKLQQFVMPPEHRYLNAALVMPI